MVISMTRRLRNKNKRILRHVKAVEVNLRNKTPSSKWLKIVTNFTWLWEKINSNNNKPKLQFKKKRNLRSSLKNNEYLMKGDKKSSFKTKPWTRYKIKINKNLKEKNHQNLRQSHLENHNEAAIQFHTL